MYNSINNGVYRCGFAQKQEAYEAAFKELFAALDHFDAHLASRRYLCGPALTEADVRLFVTLVRFDEVYVVHFKTNRKLIREYKNLHGWLRDVYQYAGGAVGRTVNMWVARGCAAPTRSSSDVRHGARTPWGIIPLVGLSHGVLRLCVSLRPSVAAAGSTSSITTMAPTPS
jgi:glutathionyl-hydroquinone reductase